MSKRILIVEDDDLIRLTLEQLLTNQGYAVLSSATGKDTFELISNFKPHLVLLDIYLGELDGREICREIKQSFEFRNLPVIIISSLPDIYNTIVDVGANDIITKPFNPRTLTNRIERQLSYSYIS